MNSSWAMTLKAPQTLVFAGLLAAWAALFHVLGNSSFGYVDTESMFMWLYRWYQLPSVGETGDELCPLVPVAVAIILYLKREELQAVPKAPWLPGLGLLLAGLVFHAAGFLTQQVRISVFGFIVGGLGLAAAVWGRALLRKITVPVLFLVFAIPIAAYTDGLTFHLRIWVTKLAVGFSQHLLGLPLQQDGTIVTRLATEMTPGFRFDVAPACSGVRSISALFFVATIYCYLSCRRPWHALVLMTASIPLAALGNVLRLVFVFMVGDALGQNAGQAVETKFGFVTYLAALGGLLALHRLLNWLDRRKSAPEPGAEQKPAELPAT